MMSAPSRSARVSGRALTTLLALAAALVAAFVVGPPTLAASRSDGGFADERDLTAAFREASVEYWRSGERDFTPGLDRVVDYWFRYHMAKAMIATILLTVLMMLGVRLWKVYLRAGRPGSTAALASAGVFVTMLAVFSLAVVMANVQGAVAPFASLLPMLPEGELSGLLADSQKTGERTPPALEMMISDFTRYHVAMAVIAAIVAVVLIGTSVLLYKRFARTELSDRRTRRVLGGFTVASMLLALLVIVVAVANTTTAADPEPALMAFFEGGR